MTFWVPYWSFSGRLISSQNTTSHLSLCVGRRVVPWGVRAYTQCCSKVFRMSSGVDAAEKLSDTSSRFGMLCSV